MTVIKPKRHVISELLLISPKFVLMRNVAHIQDRIMRNVAHKRIICDIA
jgi:hypothetical protein